MSEIQTYQRRIREIKRSMSELRSNTLQNTYESSNNTSVVEKYKEDLDERKFAEKQEQQFQEELKELRYALNAEEAEYAKREKAIRQDYESKIQRLLEEEQRMVMIEQKQHLNVVQQLNQEIETLVVSMKKRQVEDANSRKSPKFLEQQGKYRMATTQLSKKSSNNYCASQHLQFSSKDSSDKENQTFQNNSKHDCSHYDCCSHQDKDTARVAAGSRRENNKENFYEKNNRNNSRKMQVCLTENDECQGFNGTRGIAVRRINSSLGLQNNRNEPATNNESMMDCNISLRQECDSRQYQSCQSNSYHGHSSQQKQSQVLSIEPNRKEVAALIKKYRSNTLLTQQSSIIDPSLLLQQSSTSSSMQQQQHPHQQSQQLSESQFNKSASLSKTIASNIVLNRRYLGKNEQTKSQQQQQQQYWQSPSTISIQPSRVSSVVTTARQPLVNVITSSNSNILNDISIRELNKTKPPLQRNAMTKQQFNSSQFIENKNKPQLKPPVGYNADLNRSSLLDRLMESSSSEDEDNPEEKEEFPQDYIDCSTIGYYSGQQQQQQQIQDYSYQSDYY